MNYIQALQEFLQNDPEISALVGNRIGFLRMPKTVQKPYIIFNEQEWNGQLLNQDDYERGVDMFPVLIDIVVDYKQANLGRELRQKIREKIWNFSWRMGGQREGQISFLRFLACDYSVDTDGVMRWGLYFFKQSRKWL